MVANIAVAIKHEEDVFAILTLVCCALVKIEERLDWEASLSYRLQIEGTHHGCLMGLLCRAVYQIFGSRLRKVCTLAEQVASPKNIG
jgi:hypothetical protein